MGKVFVQNIGNSVPSRDNLAFLWVIFLLSSFFYEYPILDISSYDRLNPRLLDVAFLVGVFVVRKDWRFGRLSMPLQAWVLIVVWFCFCAVISFLIYPEEYGIFSLWRAAKYTEGLSILYMLSLVRFNEAKINFIYKVIFIGSCFVALYCIFELFDNRTEVELIPGVQVQVAEGTLTGPFGTGSYFQIAQTVAFCYCLMLGFSTRYRDLGRQCIFVAVSFILSWPLMFSGSRTGLGLAVIAAMVIFVIDRGIRKAMIVVAVLLVPLATLSAYDRLSEQLESGLTIQRLLEFQSEVDSDNNIENRFSISIDLDEYSAGWLLPIVGAGFYIAPVNYGGSEIYRLDFGKHNIYLFAFEQAGLIGLLLFIFFLWRMFTGLWIARKLATGSQKGLIIGCFSFLVASAIIGFGAHNFWQGFASGNFNTFFLSVAMLALAPLVRGDSLNEGIVSPHST